MATAKVLLHATSSPSSTMTSSSSTSARRRDAPSPVPLLPSHLLQHASSRNCTNDNNDDDGQRYCRHCPSNIPLYTDWAQGDVVCTQCGVVNEQYVRDSGPEWREFHDADDLAKGRPHQARSGLVIVDETRYVGGLQPTTLSRGLYMGSNFGNAGRGDNHTNNSKSGAGVGIRTRLAAASRRIEKRMEKVSREAIEAVQLHQQIVQRKRKKRRRIGSSHDDGGNYRDDENDDDDEYSLAGAAPDSDPNLRPEYERLVLQEEEDTNRRRDALYADKWSLARAIRLCGTSHEVSLLATASADNSDDVKTSGNFDNDNDNHARLDSTLQQASHDLYRVYSMLLLASEALHLPERVRGEAVELLCRYASRRDGLGVRGVSSTATPPSSVAKPGRLAKKSPHQEREARKALANYNKVKQAGALCSAILFYTSRRMGHPRPMEEVCASIRPASTDHDNPHLKAELDDGAINVKGRSVSYSGFITKKHCSKAMKEVKDLFPEVAVVNPTTTVTATPPTPTTNHPDTSTGAVTLATLDALSNAVDHKLRGLHLPPVAQAAIRSIVLVLVTEASTGTGGAAAPDLASPKSLPTLCGAVAVLVCHAGAVMQRLAAQARAAAPQAPPATTIRGSERKWPRTGSPSSPSPGSTPSLSNSPGPVSFSEAAYPSALPTLNGDAVGGGGGGSFDEFTAIVDYDDDVGAATLSSEQRAYEMGRIWDAWRTQTPWARSVPDIEQSVRAAQSSSVLLMYRRHVFPRRHSLLRKIGDAVSGRGTTTPATETPTDPTGAILREAPLSTVLLPQIPLVASLLNEDARTER